MAVIVTADDDEDIRSVITRVLRRAGHTVVAVGDGAAAVAEAQARQPDLILLDGEMPPGMSGFDACALLHDNPATEKIPIVMVTGSMSAGQVRQRLPYVHGVVGKPFTAEQLQACVRQVVGDA